MQNLIDILRVFPLVFILVIVVPLLGGVVGAYLGYDSLVERLEAKNHREHVEQELDELKLPVETIRRYETQLSADQQNTGVGRAILRQYDQLRNAIDAQSRFTGQENARDRIASGDEIIANLRSLLGETQTAPVQGGQALIIKAAPNTFRVIFPAPMRVPPNLTFPNLPSGVEAHLIEKTNIGFTVIFTPQSTPVEKFAFTASAEL